MIPVDQTPHAVDPLTCYCLRCGAAALVDLHAGRVCADTVDNVVAISHTVRGRRLAALAERPVAAPSCRAPSP